MRARALRALVAVLPALGCFAPTYGSGHLACDPSERCPSGFVCSAGRCWSPNEVPELDAAPPVEDAAPMQMPPPPPAEDVRPMADEPPMASIPLLASLEVDPGDLDPKFNGDTRAYTVNLALDVQSVTVTANPAFPGVQMSIAGNPLAPNTPQSQLLGSGGTTITIDAIAPGGTAQYKVTCHRGALSTYIKASRVRAGDHFGRAVALAGDTLVVGAPDQPSGVGGANPADESAPGSGAAYVFVRGSSGVWTQQAFIKPGTVVAGMSFGASVALAGDTLAVGAPGESSSGTGITANGNGDRAATGSGAVYVFTRSNGTWAQQAHVKPMVVAALDGFGSSVALAGQTLAVGAPGEDGEGTGVNNDAKRKGAMDAGAAYVFFRAGTTWTQQAYVKATTTKALNELGTSVALAGDTLVVGAPKEDGSSSVFDTGAAHVFFRTGTTWAPQGVLKPSNSAAGFTFGTDLDVAGDLIAVGAPLEGGIGQGVGSGSDDQKQSRDTMASGAVYVYKRSGTSWSQMAYVKASNAQAADHFGQSVALTADKLVVGAPGEDGRATGVGGDQTDNSAANAGAVYVFTIASTGLRWRDYVKARNVHPSGAFGDAVSASGPLVAVGADGESGSSCCIDGALTVEGAQASGAIYVY